MINNLKLTVLQKIDYKRKVTACSFHPKKKMFAVSSLNCFFIYSVWYFKVNNKKILLKDLKK